MPPATLGGKPSSDKTQLIATQELLFRTLIIEVRQVDFAFISIDNFTPDRIRRLRHFKDINRVRRQAARLMLSLTQMTVPARPPPVNRHYIIADTEEEDYEPVRIALLGLSRYLGLVHQFLTLRLTGLTAL